MKQLVKLFGIAALIVFTAITCSNGTTEGGDIKSLLQGTTWIKAESQTGLPKIQFVENPQSPGPGTLGMDLWCPINNHVHRSNLNSLFITGNRIYDSEATKQYYRMNYTVELRDNNRTMIITDNIPNNEVYYLAGEWSRQ